MHCPILFTFGTRVHGGSRELVIKAEATGGTCGLKWQYITNWHPF